MQHSSWCRFGLSGFTWDILRCTRLHVTNTAALPFSHNRLLYLMVHIMHVCKHIRKTTCRTDMKTLLPLLKSDYSFKAQITSNSLCCQNNLFQTRLWLILFHDLFTKRDKRWMSNAYCAGPHALGNLRTESRVCGVSRQSMCMFRCSCLLWLNLFTGC